jgi:hypothetical protein
MKPRITVGGRVTGRVELTGNSLGLSGSGSVSIFSDNYTGYGADVGIGMGISQSVAMGGSQTAGLKAGARISMNSNTQDGVGVNPSLSLSVKQQMSDVQSVSAGLSANLGYNTREGLKSTTLGASFDYSDGMDDTDDESDEITARGATGYSTSYSNTSYNTPPFYPRTTTAFKTKSNSYGFDIGGSTWLLYLGGGLTGYKTVREVLKPVTKTNAYGFMYAEAGKQDKDALMDFMREKDNPVVPNLPNLAIPIATPDLFTARLAVGNSVFTGELQELLQMHSRKIKQKVVLCSQSMVLAPISMEEHLIRSKMYPTKQVNGKQKMISWQKVITPAWMPWEKSRLILRW